MAKFQIRVPENEGYASLKLVPDSHYKHDKDGMNAAYRLWQYIYRNLPSDVVMKFQELMNEKPLWVPYSEAQHEEDIEVARRLRTGL